MADEPEKEKTPKSTAGLYDAPIARMRDTLRQLLVFFGAIGAIIVAGIQFSNIGELESYTVRWWAAILATGVAFAGVAIVLWTLVRINNSREVTLSELDGSWTHNADIRAIEVESPQLLDGYGSIRALRIHFERLVRLRHQAQDKFFATSDVAQQTRWAEEFEQLNSQIEAANAVVDSVLQFAGYRVARRLYTRWTFVAMVGAVVVGISVSILAWATNPPEDDITAASALTPVGSVVLIADAPTLDLIASEHGEACVDALDDGSRVTRLFVRRFNDDAGTVDLSSLPLPGCASFAIEVNTRLLLPASVIDKSNLEATPKAD